MESISTDVARHTLWTFWMDGHAHRAQLEHQLDHPPRYLTRLPSPDASKSCRLQACDIYHTKYTRQLSIDPPVQTRERINWRRRTRQWRLICNVRRQVHFTKWDPVIYSSRIYCKLAARKKKENTEQKRKISKKEHSRWQKKPRWM